MSYTPEQKWSCLHERTGAGDAAAAESPQEGTLMQSEPLYTHQLLQRLRNKQEIAQFVTGIPEGGVLWVLFY